MPVQFRPRLLEALVKAYDESGLRLLLFGALNVRLDDIADEGTLPDKVRQVIEWADQNGRLEDLVAAVVDDRPNSPEIKGFVNRYSRLVVPARASTTGGRALTRGEVETRDLRETVEKIVQALQGDDFSKTDGIIPRLNSYIQADQEWKRATEARIWALEEATKRRVWPWLIAGGGIVTGVIGIAMAWAERLL